MRLIIDADACPTINLCIKIAKLFNLKILLVYDTSHFFDLQNEMIENIIVDKGNDNVDFVILNKANKNDIVITQDYALASMCLTKGTLAINQNGYVYTNENIEELLLRRHINKKLRNYRKFKSKIKKRNKQDDINFEKNLIQLIKNNL